MLGVDRAGIEPALRGLARQAARRVDDLLPRAIVESDDQREAAIGARQLLGLVEQRGDVGRQARRARR